MSVFRAEFVGCLLPCGIRRFGRVLVLVGAASVGVAFVGVASGGAASVGAASAAISPGLDPSRLKPLPQVRVEVGSEVSRLKPLPQVGVSAGSAVSRLKPLPQVRVEVGAEVSRLKPLPQVGVAAGSAVSRLQPFPQLDSLPESSGNRHCEARVRAAAIPSLRSSLGQERDCHSPLRGLRNDGSFLATTKPNSPDSPLSRPKPLPLVRVAAGTVVSRLQPFPQLHSLPESSGNRLCEARLRAAAIPVWPQGLRRSWTGELACRKYEIAASLRSSQ